MTSCNPLVAVAGWLTPVFILSTTLLCTGPLYAQIGKNFLPAAHATETSANTGSEDWDWEGMEADAWSVDTEPADSGNETLGTGTSPGITNQAEAGAIPGIRDTSEPDFEVTPKEGYRLFADVPPFQVIPSKKNPVLIRCPDCHAWAESDPTPRKLKEPHNNFELKHGIHGKGEFWCFTCHHLEGDGGLRTMDGKKLDFDESYILCSQCHSQEARDWSYGSHGKRWKNWQGPRRIYNCTACHNQHAPAIKPRAPLGPPPVRMGLVRPVVPEHKGAGETAERFWSTSSDGETIDER